MSSSQRTAVQCRYKTSLLWSQTRRRRPWRWAWPTCCATIAPPRWRGPPPRPRPRRPSGSTPVSLSPHLRPSHASLVTTRQLRCESAAVSARSDEVHLLPCHAALVAALQLSLSVGPVYRFLFIPHFYNYGSKSDVRVKLIIDNNVTQN